MSAASCIVTISAQRAGEAVRDIEQVTISSRMANAVIACAAYLRQTFWPADLAAFYPYPESIDIVTVAIAAGLLVAVTIACVIAARRGHWAFMAGWLWFLGTLVPMIGTPLSA